MKRLWIVSAILVFIIGIGGWGLWHITRVTNEMENSLERISEAVEKKESGQLQELTANFELEWHKNEEIMVRYIHHEALDPITGAVARLPALARYEQYPELAAEVERIQELIYHVWKAEIPNWENIF